MADKQLASQITSAIDAASRQALRDAISNLPADTTLGTLLDGLGNSRPASMLRSMPLGEVATLLRTENGAADAGAKPRERARTRRRAKNPRKSGPNGSVRTYLRRAGKAKAEEIRAEVGGTPADIRKALFALKDEKHVRRTGKGRATVWHWRG